MKDTTKEKDFNHYKRFVERWCPDFSDTENTKSFLRDLNILLKIARKDAVSIKEDTTKELKRCIPDDCDVQDTTKEEKDWGDEIENLLLHRETFFRCNEDDSFSRVDMLYEFYEDIESLLEQAREEGKKSEKPMQGWECPKCGSVYSPLTFECSSCKNSGIKVRTSNTTSGYDNTDYLN